ncbi:40S ribosomal protein S30-B [Cytospora mali]|uniref:40S ribosomal protein S30-B n=1 Tax=Cytospora mali TaxID=578113 RepID=A0A194W9D8_CYTMA|nr:40S ribosomal protein S30-B [Valsa mali]
MGKVHGSLARAGKVKSQTPKVEKQGAYNRNEDDSGRAKKRLTYTRRFVNVQLTGGKRKVSLMEIIVVGTTTAPNGLWSIRGRDS